MAPQPREGGNAILFTAFEPSGDDHSSAVIAVLRERHPDLKIYAWGGPKMAAAGAEIVHRTGQDAVMGLPGLSKIREHQQINKDIARWLERHKEVVLHVPVDSPAANFPICKIAKGLNRRVMHLVAPQLWAWGSWRIKKLKRVSDLVLCLLPFEEAWFHARGMNARFIGHPLFDEELDMAAIQARADELVRGTPSVALLPGSRPAEIRRNFPVMLSTYRKLRERHPKLRAVVAATTEVTQASLYEHANLHGGWPEGMDVIVGETDAVIAWCDIALVVSGTVTMQVAKQRKPMVMMYKTNEFMFKLIARRLLTTPHYTLPNLIAGREVIPELVPYFKDEGQLFKAAQHLITHPESQAAQREALAGICEPFKGRVASIAAADAIEEMAGLRGHPRVPS